MVRQVRGHFGSGVVAIGTGGVTTLHPREMGKPELSPSLEAESSSLVDSSRMACSDGDSLCAIPINMVHKSFPSVEKLRLSKRSMTNSRFPK
jgi:hypothetical protein